MEQVLYALFCRVSANARQTKGLFKHLQTRGCSRYQREATCVWI